MRVLISGSHGLIGSALLPSLQVAGHDVVRLVRPVAEGQGNGHRDDPSVVTWDPAAGRLDVADLKGVEAVVNLAGAGIFDRRWTSGYLGTILDSRVRGTLLLAEALSRVEPLPRVLLSGSAVGFYGDCGDELVTEDDGPGRGFLPEVCQQWEAATAAAEAAGIRVVHLRTGIVQSAAGGALAKQLPLFRFGVGGRLGHGEQYVSWISIDDEVGAIEFALTAASLRGPVNLTAPVPVTNAEYARELAEVLHRPAFLAVPATALHLAFGRQKANEMVLTGARVMPTRLQSSGYQFRHATLDDALSAIVGRS